ncbi:27130_t:CDS:2 [Dentiscutata erythropus]|uniref:Histone H1 n=1 Tax=Dentiscutata erythropus TaxID=1348616 RepID=A0A9N9ACN6_9GLOM|nr:27130_t:CDS:2 [Dentiscutata erythropus]
MPRRPTYEKMIEDAILTLNERRGSSRQAIKKYLFETYELTDIPATYTRINTAIRKGVANGKFKYSKGPSSKIGLVKKPKRAKKETEMEEVKTTTRSMRSRSSMTAVSVSPHQSDRD